MTHRNGQWVIDTPNQREQNKHITQLANVPTMISEAYRIEVTDDLPDLSQVTLGAHGGDVIAALRVVIGNVCPLMLTRRRVSA